MSQYAQIKNKMNSLRFALSDENLQLMPEFQQRLQVLQTLNYIDADKTVLIKGRVAREVCDFTILFNI
jgi:antiviral helicase SKI2